MTQNELFAYARRVVELADKTQEEIAQDLGISQAAVSFGLSRSPGTAISIIEHYTGRKVTHEVRYNVLPELPVDLE